jgi:hypothetical protein
MEQEFVMKWQKERRPCICTSGMTSLHHFNY